MNTKIERYPSYPLITCDPYFSVWSMCDKLNGDLMRHWTGAYHPMTGIITTDGTAKTFMGRLCANPNNTYGPKKIEQKSVCVTPLKTTYVFADEKIELEVCFMTPLILDNPKIMSRPISYISYRISSVDGKEHECSVYIDVSALLCVNEPDEKVTFGRTAISVYASSGEENMLKKSGDDLRINWGFLHIAARSGVTGVTDDSQKANAYRIRPLGTQDFMCKTMPAKGVDDISYPALYYKNEYKVGKNTADDFICIGYNDIHSLEYFGKQIDAYYKKDGGSFYEALKDSLDNYESIVKDAEQFDKRITDDAKRISDDYSSMISIAYRQAVAAHKLAFDGQKAVFVSKECFSDGCAATVDVTYPSIPLFLLYNPDLVEYMLNPIFDYAERSEWKYDYAPHDVGIYPILNGQQYSVSAGELTEDCQMPVEESGNMLLCTAALCKVRNNADYAKEHFALLEKWADYLCDFGFDPENQLCTDDFAGHLAHNCNLSVKAICGIAAWAMLLEMMGKDGGKYAAAAREFAAKWKDAAQNGDHYRLAFDIKDSWSIKYNLVWDKILELNVFDKEIFEKEVEFYKTKINEYGVPLDSRSDFAKTDWQMWSTVLTDDREYTDAVISAIVKMLTETNDRFPFTDWYYSKTGISREFRNRTVQGGLFINLLKH